PESRGLGSLTLGPQTEFNTTRAAFGNGGRFLDLLSRVPRRSFRPLAPVAESRNPTRTATVGGCANDFPGRIQDGETSRRIFGDYHGITASMVWFPIVHSC